MQIKEKILFNKKKERISSKKIEYTFYVLD